MKNYFILLTSSYITILLTKFIFVFYLNEQFNTYSIKELCYAIFWGIKFDLAASAIFAFVVSCFDFNKKLFAFTSAITIITILLVQISNIFYFEEAGRHIGYEISDLFQDAYSLFMTAISQHTIITLSSLLCSILIFTYTYKTFKNIKVCKINKYFFLKKFFIILLTIFFIRGMFQHIPLHPWQANEIGNSDLANISLNSIYNIVYSLANEKKKLSKIKIEKLPPSLIESSLKEIYTNNITENNNFPLIKNRPNIIFLFSESWSAKHMSAYGFKHKTTPIYDNILKQSLRPKFMIANGHRTTEGVFATLVSYQNPLGKSIAKTQLQNYKYSSIISELTEIGYESAFFQGSSKDTSGTGSLVNSLGFKKSYGKRDITKRIYEENYWGVQDTDLYKFIETKLHTRNIKEPFVLGINGATTHDIIVPDNQPLYNFSEKDTLNKKLNALRFADQELGKFISNIENSFPNTIFVIFSDHCGGAISGTLENYMIPFAIYSKKHIQPKYIDSILSQRDIAPSLYDLVIGLKKDNKMSFTGKSIFRTNKFYADYFHNGILGWIENTDLIEVNTSTLKMSCYKIQNYTKKKKSCSSKNLQMKHRALSFTTTSQKLLFDGKTQDFYKYK